MTISSTSRKAGPFTGNGVTVAFPFAFKVFAAADVLAVQAVTATGVETTQVLTTNYTVALNADQNASPGGTLTLLVAPPTGTTLTLTSQVANTQGTDLTNAGGFYPKVINDALDRLTILCQQVAEKVSRAVTVTISSGADPAALIASIFAANTSSSANATAAAGSATASAGSATAAAGSATAAAGSATAAAGSATSAATSATNAAATALSTLLAGVSFVTNAAITAADSILIAFGKLQAQVTAIFATLGTLTGVTMDYIGSSAPAGFVLASGRTIGNAASGATERANADTSALFTMLWTSMANTEAAVSTGRGASAAADFAANKTITLPDLRGRVIVGKDNMGGTTAGRMTATYGPDGTLLGGSGGAQSITLANGNVPYNQTGIINLTTGATGVAVVVDPNHNANAAIPSTVVQPSYVMNKIIKL